MYPFHGYASGYNAPHASYSVTPNVVASTSPPPHPRSHYAAAYSSHYAQAYQPQHYPSVHAAPGMTGLHQYSPLPSTSRLAFVPPPSSSSWYSPGTCRCTYPDCNFVGSAKSLEIHRMDRHLIYPPGWKDRKRKPDWDADPSLIGKPVPVQGTGVVLDTPEKIEDWIAERKKRWPTKERAEDKQQKREEAIARGQLDLSEPVRKRRRMEEDDGADGTRGRGRGRGRARGQPAGRGRGAAMTRLAPAQGPSGLASLPAKPTAAVIEAANAVSTPVPSSLPVEVDADSSSDGDENGAPLEVATIKSGTLLESYGSDSDEPPSAAPSAWIQVLSGSAPEASAVPHVSTLKDATITIPPPQPPKRHQQQAPRRAQPNPFAPKRSLLRSLLLPEIRMTVSNLSQAIRFLVDNDFLEGVELRPGEANERMIEVVSETSN